MFSLICYEETCSEHGWYAYNIKIIKDKGINVEDAYNAVIETLYYTISIMLYVKSSIIIEFLLHEKIIRHIMVFVAYYVYSLFFSEICAATVLSLQEARDYREYITKMQMFLSRNKIVQNLRKQVAAFIEFKWAYNKNVIVTGKSVPSARLKFSFRVQQDHLVFFSMPRNI